MAKKSKDFLVSTADVAFYVDDKLAFTGTTSLNTSLSVSMKIRKLQVVRAIRHYININMVENFLHQSKWLNGKWLLWLPT